MPWVVSYDAAADIDALYASFAALRARAVVQRRRALLRSETMFFSRGLKVPPNVPANVPSEVVNAARLAV
jgi:hypothetical protein